MSVAVQEECLCGLEQRPDIWLCEHHRYFRGGVRYTSVSKVKRTLLPDDYDAIEAVDARVLENARQKGKFVDAYFSEWLVSPVAMMDLDEFRDAIEPSLVQDRNKSAAEHADDAKARLSMLLEWWQKSGMALRSTQHIFFNDDDLTAGTADVVTEDMILDLKLVSKLQPSYKLQLGAYATMDRQDFPKRDVAIIHVTKDKVRLVQYKTSECRRAWKAAVAWYNTIATL